GHACSNIAAISPAVIDPPSKCKVTRIRRRTGCASAVKTAWYASIFTLGVCLRIPLHAGVLSPQANHCQSIFSVWAKCWQRCHRSHFAPGHSPAIVVARSGPSRWPRSTCPSGTRCQAMEQSLQIDKMAGALMLVDDFLPEFDVRTHHAIRVAAPPDRVYACLWETDFDHWGLTRALYALRTLPAFVSAPGETRRRFLNEVQQQHFTLPDLLAGGFALLDEQPGSELVLGTVGRFWRARGELQATEPQRFVEPAPPGTAKAALNFLGRRHPNGGTELRTETRVLCADAVTRRRFRAYWMLIRPFSGLIRREMLVAVRAQAEATAMSAGTREENKS